MISSKQDQLNHLEFAKNLRIIEMIFFGVVLLYGFLTTFNYLVFEDTLTYINDFNSLVVVRVALIIGSLLFSLMIRSNFILYDEDPRSDKWFKLAIFGLVPGYTIIATYLPVLSNNGAIGLNQWINVILIMIFFVTTSFLLHKKYSWEQSSLFVKLRLSAMILGYIAFYINANLALFLSFICIGPLLLIPFEPRKN